METCANCGRTIGNLETPRLHQEHVVCKECCDRLQSKPPPMPIPTVPTVDRSKIPPWRRGRRDEHMAKLDRNLKYIVLVVVLLAIVIWLLWSDLGTYIVLL